ncbi:MAG: 50S ribosomal protein L23 [Promethearchaeota archaeon]
MENAYYKILVRPVVTENTFDLIEEENKLTFIVDRKANKNMIKEAMEHLYGVKVVKVNTLITQFGKKKAFIKLSDKDSAADIAIDLGIF